MPIESLDVKTIENIETKHVDVGRNSSIRSKILTHFIKGANVFPSHGNYFSHYWWVGVLGKLGQTCMKEAGCQVEISQCH